MAPPSWPDQHTAIDYALYLVGLTDDRADVRAFYRETFDGHPDRFVTYDDLRKRGTPLDKASLAALGLSPRVKLAAEFFATLNERGRADPIDAACKIGLAISAALCSIRDLRRMAGAGIKAAVLRPSALAVGPCERAGRVGGRVIALDATQVLPLPECDRPGECACIYQARFEN
ncbi:hypothetical protein [Erythrobacter sp. BLCC-B19]|uniref:hypothetical protein n=1 Tax=Erythrobacter sp. BLCC-B19 TaxID=3025315 RepID=UPI0023628ABA|nr:hypothetical protein [Erythrobacter sp. BLCC-B19]WDA41386.1 hypothetical protein PS060_00845 [Erythrobacter sp. BLCC-B19]